MTFSCPLIKTISLSCHYLIYLLLSTPLTTLFYSIGLDTHSVFQELLCHGLNPTSLIELNVSQPMAQNLLQIIYCMVFLRDQFLVRPSLFCTLILSLLLLSTIHSLIIVFLMTTNCTSLSLCPSLAKLCYQLRNVLQTSRRGCTSTNFSSMRTKQKSY